MTNTTYDFQRLGLPFAVAMACIFSVMLIGCAGAMLVTVIASTDAELCTVTSQEFGKTMCETPRLDWMTGVAVGLTVLTAGSWLCVGGLLCSKPPRK